MSSTEFLDIVWVFMFVVLLILALRGSVAIIEDIAVINKNRRP